MQRFFSESLPEWHALASRSGQCNAKPDLTKVSCQLIQMWQGALLKQCSESGCLLFLCSFRECAKAPAGDRIHRLARIAAGLRTCPLRRSRYQYTPRICGTVQMALAMALEGQGKHRPLQAGCVGKHCWLLQHAFVLTWGPSTLHNGRSVAAHAVGGMLCICQRGCIERSAARAGTALSA